MIKQLFIVFFLIHFTLAQKAWAKAKPAPVNPGPKKTWLTLKGAEPVVIARGGSSGIFPESSKYAYTLALQTSLPNSLMYCDLQLTKDNLGVCQSELKLDNSTNAPLAFPKGQKTYNVNGQEVTGWFALDFTLEQLQKNIFLNQNLLSRSNVFDGMMPIWTLDELGEVKPTPRFWINVQYDMFYNQHKLSVARYIQDSTNLWVPTYISSPEIGFLKTMSAGKIDKTKTKLIFRFLNPDAVEPTTKEKYGAILGKLSTIKPFASGILVPKEFIWPVTKDNYLEPATTLVADAHKEGLEVYASGFANDLALSYNYSYDPTAEYLQFVDNSQFAVDGVLTDYPSTASEAISCLAQNQNITTKTMKALIISHNGASGDYPGCTDLAYEKAINDGADIIDCSVQISKDGMAFCLDSADLSGKTTAAMTLMDRSVSIPEVQTKSGIFSFDLTWSEIQSLKPQIVNTFAESNLQRNPRNKNAGKFVTLPEFLELAKTKATIGVLITIQNAAYLASKKGLDIVDTVTTALSNATLDKQSTRKVLIQSDDSSVLAKFKDVLTYQRVLLVKDVISDAPKPLAEEVKKYADAVTIPRRSVVQSNAAAFSTGFSNVVEEMHAANVSVYIAEIMNEFTNFLFDCFADPYVELATFVADKSVDGVITDFPKSASAYMRTPCADLNANLDYTILPIKPGDMLNIIPPMSLPPAASPDPPLENADIVDPPLPAVADVSADSDNSTSTTVAPPPKSSSQPKISANANLSIVASLMICLLSMIR